MIDVFLLGVCLFVVVMFGGSCGNFFSFCGDIVLGADNFDHDFIKFFVFSVFAAYFLGEDFLLIIVFSYMSLELHEEKRGKKKAPAPPIIFFLLIQIRNKSKSPPKQKVVFKDKISRRKTNCIPKKERSKK